MERPTTKTILQRSVTDSGQTEYVEMTDITGLIALTRLILKAQPGNRAAQELVDWVDSLDHEPTGEEFNAWFTAKGGKLKKLRR